MKIGRVSSYNKNGARWKNCETPFLPTFLHFLSTSQGVVQFYSIGPDYTQLLKSSVTLSSLETNPPTPLFLFFFLTLHIILQPPIPAL